MTRDEAIRRIKSWNLDSDDMEVLSAVVPELRESQDERIRKEIISALKFANNGGIYDKHIAYLEKQKENNEYVFRPLAGTDITIAAEQAIRRANEGDRLVLAFNGAYIPVRKGCNANKIVDIYDAFIEKQKEQTEELSIRLNGLMQEYVKAGEDEEEQEHRLKCYQLFWDALGDSEFFEQKEQKHPDGCLSCNDYKKGYEAGRLNGITVGYNKAMKEQKPVKKEITLTNFEEILNTFLFDFANSSIEDCEPKEYIKKHSAEILKVAYTELNAQLKQDIFEAMQEGRREGYEAAKAEQKPTEWSEEDMGFLYEVMTMVQSRGGWVRSDDAIENVKSWLNALPKRFNLQPKQEWSEEDINKIRSEEYTKGFNDAAFGGKLKGWSKEDETMINHIIEALPKWANGLITILPSQADEYVKRLKSLRPQWKPIEKKYDGNMDKECIKLCDTLNSIPSIDTFGSCCGHLKDRYSIWFFCNDIITISRLGRCVERNYSDGKWELLVDSTDTHPTCVFWLRSKVPFQSYDEMEKSVNELCNHIQHWFNTKFDSYFNGNSGK